jgi:autotransporter-associated beta strand protein
MGLPAVASAQISGNWLPDADGVWSDPNNWSSNAAPNGGGIATFPLLPYSSAGHTVGVDIPVTLSAITFDTPFTFTLSNAGGSLTMTGSAQIGAFDGPPNTRQVLPPGHVIAATIGGSAGLNKTGPASVWLQGTNTFTGTVNISGGALYVSDNNNAALGNAANTVAFNGASALANISQNNIPFTTGRNFTLGPGAVGELRNFAPMTISGQITGAPDATLVKRLNTGTLTLTGNNTYTSGTIIRDGGFVVLSGANGAISGTSSIYLDGGISSDNSAAARSGRMGPNAITSNGGSIGIIGNPSTATGESNSQIQLFGGTSFINLVASAGAATTLDTAQLNRVGRSTFLARGDKLGAGTGATFTTFRVGNSSSLGLIGGGGASGSTNISIVPWALGNSTSGSTLNSGSNSLITYVNGVGFRPLDTNTEYVSDINAAASDSNVRLSSAQTNNAPRTINSLTLNAFDLSGSTITINSGAVAVVASNGQVCSAPLAFGAREAIFHTSSNGTFSGVISGSNGLTKADANALALSGANTYTGTTTIVAGQLWVMGNVPSDGSTPNPLGLSTTPIEMYGGSGPGLARLYGRGDANITISRPLSVNLIAGQAIDAVAAIGNRTINDPTGTFTYNGAIAVNGGALRFEFDTNPAGVINGAISGPGRVTDAFGSAQTLNGNNTYTGGTTIITGTWLAGSDTAFGSGSIVFTNTSAPSSAIPFPGAIGASGAARTIANPILNAAFGPDQTPGALGMVVVGSLPLTLSGPMDLGGSGARWITVNNTADTTISGAISRGGLVKNGPGRLILSGANTYTGLTTAHSGTLVFGRSETNTALQVDSGAVAELSAGGNKVLALRSLLIAGGPAAPTGTLDLHDNDMLVNASSYANITAQIRFARNGGAWNRPGITSTEARNAPSHNTTLGTLRGSEFHAAQGASATFDGLGVNNSDVLVKYTWYGDTDFNGRVNFDDYVRTDNGFNNHLTGWLNGDFDYNGVVNFDDYVLIDLAFNTQSGTLGRSAQWLTDGGDTSINGPAFDQVVQHTQEFGEGYVRSFLAAVPEPSSVASLTVVSLCVTLHRKRKNRPKFPLCDRARCEYISRH